MKKHSVPKWQQEISSFKGIKSTFIIEGNINDFYPLYEGRETPLAFVDLNMTLLRLFNERKEDTDYEFLFCDPATGIYNKFGDRYGNIEEMFNKYATGTDEEPLPFGIDRLFKKSCKLDDIFFIKTIFFTD